MFYNIIIIIIKGYINSLYNLKGKLAKDAFQCVNYLNISFFTFGPWLSLLGDGQGISKIRKHWASDYPYPRATTR